MLQATTSNFELESIDDDLHFIPKCVGVGRELWEKLVVILCNAYGVDVDEGVVLITSPNSCIDNRPLGENDLGVMVMDILCEEPGWTFELGVLKCWLIHEVMYNGVSLFDHNKMHLLKRKGCWIFVYHILAHGGIDPQKGHQRSW